MTAYIFGYNRVYDYRIVEKLDVNTMKPHFIIEKYNLTTREYNLYSLHPPSNTSRSTRSNTTN